MKYFLAISFCFAMVARGGPPDASYVEFKAKSDLILWAKVLECEVMTPEKDGKVAIKFRLADLNVLKGKGAAFESISVLDESAEEKEYWLEAARESMSGGRALLCLRNRPNGGYSFQTTTGSLGFGAFPRVDSSRKFATLEDLLVFLYFGKDVETANPHLA